MSKFTDAKNRTFTLHLTVGMLGKIRRETGIDVGKALSSESSFSEVVFADPENLVAMLWVMIEGQMPDLAPEEFAAGFDGSTLESATTAILECIADFFPRSRIGKLIRENLPKILDQMDSRMEESLKKALNNSPGSSPESPESTPGILPFAKSITPA